MPKAGTPQISVIIGSRNAARTIRACLTSLEEQFQSEMAEIIVADCSTDETPRIIASDFPKVKLVRCPAGQNTAQLRATALREARGELVAVTEPHCVIEPGWLVAICRAFESGEHLVVGGSVRPAGEPGSAVWAAFLSEYAAYLPPLPPGPVAMTTGNNVAYRLDDLLKCDVRAEFWKIFASWELKAAGVSFRADPAMQVQHIKPYNTLHFTGQRYHYGRCFAAERLKRQNLGLVQRLYHLLTLPALPALQLWRLYRDIRPKPAYRRHFRRGLPWLVLFSFSWSLGEGLGYLAGPGHSCQEVY